MHVIAKSDCMEDGRYIPDRFIGAYHNASQPPTEPCAERARLRAPDRHRGGVCVAVDPTAANALVLGQRSSELLEIALGSSSLGNTLVDTSRLRVWFSFSTRLCARFFSHQVRWYNFFPALFLRSPLLYSIA
jgi:hypothetical protein